MSAFLDLKIKLLLTIILLGIANCLSPQPSALLLEENFDFPEGSNVAGQNDWTQGTAGTNAVIISGDGLDYAGYPGSDTGLAADFSPLSDRIQKSFTGSLTDSYFYAFLINVSSAGAGEFIAGFYSQSAFRGRIYIKADGEGFQFGLVKTTTGTVTYTQGTPYVFGTTYLVAVHYRFIPGTGNDEVSLFINPDLNANLPETPDVGALTDAGNDVSANVFAIQGRNNSGAFTLDAIRIATSWDAIRGIETVNHFLELPRCISSHAVLQRETPLKFWGWGAAGDTVCVEFTREGTVFSGETKINSDGRWNVSLPAQPACAEPCRLGFWLKNRSETLQTLDDILVGDVWFAGGQSNMEKKVSHLLEASQYISEADNYPDIRSFRASYNQQTEPSEKVNAASAPWFVCNSDNLGENVSAVAYVFAREIYDSIRVPIGIMQAYRGGTELETWVSPGKFAEPEYCKIAGRNDFLETSNTLNYHSAHFNGQVNPLINYPVKGFIWYQGESNIKRAPEYRYMMKMLIEDWRALWNQGNLPFYYLQLFNVSAAKIYEESTWSDLREQQLFLLDDVTVPNTGMAVIIDTNEDPANSDDAIRMHPHNKKPAGERLAAITLRNTYGFEFQAEGPGLNHYRISNDTVYAVFKNVGDGLKIKDGETTLNGFVLSGADQRFKTATAVILNDSTVAVVSPDVAVPVALRYAWARNPICNLYNSKEIPATPFRTDMWNLSSYTLPQTSCATPDGNTKLVSVYVNGKALKNFNPEQITYNINAESFGNAIHIVAVPDNPLSTVTTARNGDKMIITVTAENSAVKTYELNLDGITSLKKNFGAGIEMIRNNDQVTIRNLTDESYNLMIVNTAGQCFVFDVLNRNSKTNYNLPRGIYLFRLSDSSGNTETKKYPVY